MVSFFNFSFPERHFDFIEVCDSKKDILITFEISTGRKRITSLVKKQKTGVKLQKVDCY